ncbi:hypothetical protein C1H46_001609 [Malus baccata]|uniref:Uncharacterized protein n=1 Tax=Malus baccata TaxID=106549 RepID=A0A540NNW5_MALBA|nr:hypothetical protein C1H46_001609 [Malus baccata]
MGSCDVNENLNQDKFSASYALDWHLCSSCILGLPNCNGGRCYPWLSTLETLVPLQVLLHQCNFFDLDRVAIKLSVDLNTLMPSHQDQLGKLNSSAFICIVMGNTMPSLGVMKNKEMMMNAITFGILIITLIVNICIQLATSAIFVFCMDHAFIMFIMLVLLIMMNFSALTVPSLKDKLNQDSAVKVLQRSRSSEIIYEQ